MRIGDGIPKGMNGEHERCVHCGAALQYGLVTKDEWAHVSGARYCRDMGGFTATPLQVATPLYHPKNAVL